MRFPFLVAIAAFLPGSLAVAEPAFEPNTALWAAGTARSVLEAPVNPGNRFAQVPENSALLELRPDWRLGDASWKLVARPRLMLTRDHTRVNGASSTHTLALTRWSEAFATWSATPAFSVDYGLQNFQWGPAESASPSNRLFRDTVQVKDTLYLVRGEHLLRLTYSPGAAWSEVLLFEPTGNGEAEPEAGVPHSLKAALKSELAWNGGADFAGLVTGWRDASGFWLGQYVNLELLDGRLYAYADAEEESGSLAWYPRVNAPSGLVTYAQSRRFDGAVTPFAVSGLRYAFENGNDARVEWIHHGSGYSTAELGRAAVAVTSANLLQLATLATQAEALRATGLDFPSRDYLFSSVRFPNSFGVRDWNLYVRFLESLQDHSVSAFASTENRLGERGTVIGGVSAALGRATDELKGVVDFAATIAYRHAW